MRINKMRELLERGKGSVGTRVWSTWPFITEAVGATGKYDYIEFTAEYAPYAEPDLENICRAAELYGMGKMIKLDFQNRAFAAQKAIAAGFEALMLADHKTAQEVRDSIWYIRADSGPDGGRYGKPCRRFNLEGSKFVGTADYVKQLENIVVVLMIEKREAVEDLEEILSVPGVDMVQWGPADYSLSMGWERPEKNREIAETERYVIETALRMGVEPRCEIGTAEDAGYYRSLGVKHFSLGDEVRNNMNWWSREGGALRDIIAGGAAK